MPASVHPEIARRSSSSPQCVICAGGAPSCCWLVLRAAPTAEPSGTGKLPAPAGVLGEQGGTLALLCNHSFCKRCILTWRQVSRRCPICRQRDTRELGPRRSSRVHRLVKQLLQDSDTDLSSLLDPLLQVHLSAVAGTSSVAVLPPQSCRICPVQELKQRSRRDRQHSSGLLGHVSEPEHSNDTGLQQLDRQLLDQLVAVLQESSSQDGQRGAHPCAAQTAWRQSVLHGTMPGQPSHADRSGLAVQAAPAAQCVAATGPAMAWATKAQPPRTAASSCRQALLRPSAKQTWALPD